MFKKGFKKSLLVFLCMALIVGICFSFSTNTTKVSAAAVFANGADIGWLNQLENNGVKWQNDSGVQQDALQILKDHGINSVRLRVFVNPPSNYYWQKSSTTLCMLGYSDKTGVLYMAKRAQNLGMRVMVDFHYSDHFADPGYQDKPAAWANHSFAQLQTDVYNHTYDIMSGLAAEGVYPEWVQVGNETNSGMMWPDGYADTNFTKWAQLINQGYSAVKKASSSSKVIIHVASGENNSFCRKVFDGLKAAGANWDAEGFSYYPYWGGGPINATSANLNDMAARYGKPVGIVEVGGAENDPAGTYTIIQQAIAAVKAVPNGNGFGVFYWEPECNSTVLPDAYPLGATNVVSGKVLKFTTALDAFKDTNLIINPSFDLNGATQTPTGWNKWDTSSASFTETNGGSHTGSYHGAHWKASQYSCSTYQVKTGLANGTYTMRAWVKSSGGQTTAQMYAKGFGGTEIDYSIKTAMGNWTQITINNINITNGSIECGFYSVANASNWINFDDVSLTKN